jgi:hypothetical protein
MSSRGQAWALALLLAIVLLFLLIVETARGANPHQLVRGFMCIHKFEAPWAARTGNGYYGGLQMDMEFQRAYGSEFLAAFGTADNWPPAIQITVAVRAYLSGRGFGPWPNTRRLCGL